QARNTSRTSTTETSRNDTPTPTSHDLERSDSGPDQTPRHDTPGGPITGNRVVPCSWQKTAQSGPMIMAGDTTTGTRPGAPGGGCRLPRPTPAQPGQIRPGTIPGGLRRFPPGITDHFPSLVRRLTEGWRFPCLRRVSQYRSGVVAAAGW